MLFSRSVWSLYTIGDKRSVALLKKAVLVPKKKSITNPTDINEPLLSISKVRVCFYSRRPCIEYCFFCFCRKLISMKATDNSKIIALNYDSITSSKKSWVNVFIFLMLFLFSISYLRMFFEIRVLQNFANLPENTCVENPFYQNCSSTVLQVDQKRLPNMCLPVKFSKFLRTPFFYRTPLVAVSKHHRIEHAGWVNNSLDPHICWKYWGCCLFNN